MHPRTAMGPRLALAGDSTASPLRGDGPTVTTRTAPTKESRAIRHVMSPARDSSPRVSEHPAVRALQDLVRQPTVA